MSNRNEMLATKFLNSEVADKVPQISPLAESIIRSLPLPKQFTNKIPNKSSRMKVLNLDGPRYTVVVENNAVVSVLDKGKELEVHKLVQTIHKIEQLFGDHLHYLHGGVYVFDLCINRHLFIFDILYNNSVPLLETSWADRITMLRNLGIMSKLIKVPVEREDKNIHNHDFSRTYGVKIVRSLDVFAPYTEEYKICGTTTAMYVVVGEAIMARSFKTYLSLTPYTSLSQVSKNAQNALLENVPCDDLTDEDKLVVLNSLREQHIVKSQPKPHVIVKSFDEVLLVAARNQNDELEIIGTAKPNIILDTNKNIIPKPDSISWCNDSVIAQFQPNSINFYKRLLVVDCKRITKFNNRLVTVNINSIQAYYDVDQLNYLQNIDMVSINNNFNTSNLQQYSFEDLLVEIHQRINAEIVQNPDQKYHRAALKDVDNLFTYNIMTNNYYKQVEQQSIRKLKESKEIETKILSTFKTYSSDNEDDDDDDDDDDEYSDNEQSTPMDET